MTPLTASPELIDAHHHVWDLQVRPQTWMAGDELAPISRSFLVEELEPVAASCGVAASVVVQTVSDPAETPELLRLAATGGLVKAVVGWVDLQAPDVAERVADLRDAPGGSHLAGIRHQVHDEPDVGWLCRPNVRRGLRAVGEAGLPFDLLLRPAYLPAAVATARALPDQVFVVDHAAKPRVAAGLRRAEANDDWREGLRQLAACGNVVCKLSGLPVEAEWQRWHPDDLRPYAELVVEEFGPGRVMVGSDWPVCLLAATYSESLHAYDPVIDALSPAERHLVRSGTAARVYRIQPS